MSDLPMSKEECEKWQAEFTASCDRLCRRVSEDADKARYELFKAKRIIRALTYDPSKREWSISDRDLAALGLTHEFMKITEQ